METKDTEIISIRIDKSTDCGLSCKTYSVHKNGINLRDAACYTTRENRKEEVAQLTSDITAYSASSKSDVLQVFKSCWSATWKAFSIQCFDNVH